MTASRLRPWLPAFGFAAAAGAGIVLVYLVHPALSGFRLPIGPDGPVYTWLARLAGAVGFQDAPGGGPGVPALTLFLGRVFGTEPVETVTLLGTVIAAATGLAAGALLETTLGEDRIRTAAGVAMTGGFAAYLAGGWLANLTMVAIFLVAIAALSATASSSRSAWAGGTLLAAAGLGHRIFIVIGAAILLSAAAWQLLSREGRDRRSRPAAPALRLGAAALGGPAAALLLGAWIGTGPRVPGDTSQDGFFRRLGLRTLLLDRYRERFLDDTSRAAIPMALGLGLSSIWATGSSPRDRGTGTRPALGSATEGGRYLREILGAWAVLSAVGIVVLGVTGWGPPYRVIQFAFFLPVAAAAGIATFAGRSRLLAIAGALAVAAFVAASMVGWFRQAPAFSSAEVAAAARAGMAASSMPSDTPLVFLVDTDEPAAAYHVSRAANVIRMAVPAERIPDVRVAVGRPGDFLAGRPTRTGDFEHDRLSEVYLREVSPFLDRAAILVVRRFNPDGFEEALDQGVQVSDGVVALSRGEEMDSAATDEVAGPPGLGLSALFVLSLASLALLGLIGWGWARWILIGSTGRGVVLAAPSVGAAVAIIATVAADRVGLLPSSSGALIAVASLAVAGYLVPARDER